MVTGPHVEPGINMDLFDLKKSTSVLVTAAVLTVMDLMNVVQGMLQVEGEM